MGFPVMHFQILAKDPDRAVAFYGGLCGWTASDDNPMRYRQLDTGSARGIQGGVWPVPPEGHSFVQLHIEVDDVAAQVETARGLGATVVFPPQALPAGEVMAVLTDPEGIPFVLFSPAKG